MFTLALTALTIYFACSGIAGRRLESEVMDLSKYIKENYEAIDKDSFFSEKNITVYDENGRESESFGNPEIKPVSGYIDLVTKACNEGASSKNEYSFFESNSRYTYFERMDSGEVIAVTAKSYITHTAFAGVIIPTLLIALLIYALSSIISVKLTENIVKPIEEINPLDGDCDSVYDEIKPFVKRITDQNKKIKEQMKTLSETEKIRREFSSNVSHELKTPLTTVHGYAQLINSGMAKKEDIPEFTKKIEKETKRLITLTDDITKLSRLDEGQQLTDKERIDLKEIALEVKDKLKSLADQRDIDFNVIGKSFFIEANYNQIVELMYNLCENAIKYNKENGSVRVNVEGNKISVKDTGIGIPKEDINRIFERFFRVDKSHSKTVNGTGLGLSIVKHIALINKADITVESVLGEGTEFTVVFNNI